MKPRIAIVNFHYGLPLNQEALFKKLGFDVNIVTTPVYSKYLDTSPTLSGSGKISLQMEKAIQGLNDFLLRYKRTERWFNFNSGNGRHPLPFGIYRWLLMLGIINRSTYIAMIIDRLFPIWPYHSWTDWALKVEFFAKFCSENAIFQSFFKDINYIISSFPPSLIHPLKIIADQFNITLINNIGHRFNLFSRSREDNIRIKKLVKEIYDSPKHILTSSALYDVNYTRHYLNVEPTLTPMFSFHIPQKVTTPQNRTILIGPANIRRVEHLLPQLDELLSDLENERCKFYNSNSTLKPFDFKEIKAVYTSYRLEQLAQHPAVVIFPYSSYAVSLEELYDLNIPFFVPSVDFMIKHQIISDRALPKLWCSVERYKQMEDDFDHPDSPNSYNETALRKWIPFSSFYQKQNAIIFNDFADLMEKVRNLDQYGNELRQKMFDENSRRRDEILKQWRTVLNLPQ